MNIFMNPGFIILFMFGLLGSIIVYQQITHRKTVIQLIDRIMAKNYGEIVQGQQLSGNSGMLDQGIHINLPEEDNDPNGVDALNKIL